jgi:hypothetical protein
MNDTELSTSDLNLQGLPLLDSPWSVRFAQGTRHRRALEVYLGELLLDVMVESALSVQLLRGARRGTREGRRSVLVWGRLPPDGEPPRVLLGRTGRPIEAIAIAGSFWLAFGAGSAGRVTAVPAAGAAQRLRVRPGWSR